MNEEQTATLLAFISQVDHPIQPSKTVVAAWMDVLGDVPYDIAKNAVTKAVRNGARWLKAGDVLAGCRPALAVLERDRRIREIEHDRRVEFLDYTGRTDFDALTQPERDEAMRDARQAHWDAGQKALTNGSHAE